MIDPIALRDLLAQRAVLADYSARHTLTLALPPEQQVEPQALVSSTLDAITALIATIDARLAAAGYTQP